MRGPVCRTLTSMLRGGVRAEAPPAAGGVLQERRGPQGLHGHRHGRRCGAAWLLRKALGASGGSQLRPAAVPAAERRATVSLTAKKAGCCVTSRCFCNAG